MNSKKNTSQKEFWIYLHPYVYVSVKFSHAILYNTLNGFLLDYRNNPEMIRLLKKLNSDRNLYVIKIGEGSLTPGILQFIRKVRDSFSGDIMPVSYGETKPINFKPIPGVQYGYDDLISNGRGKRNLLARDSIRDYLDVLAVYINNECNQRCTFCSFVFRQCDHCHSSNGKREELSLDIIKRLMDEVKSGNVSNLKILGGDIFRYSQFPALVRLLDKSGLQKEYYIQGLNLKSNISKLKLLSGEKNLLNILEHSPFNFCELSGIIEECKGYGVKVKVMCLIETGRDLETIADFLERFPLYENDISLIPIFNGANIDFFENYVYLTRESIVDAKSTLKEIFSRSLINTNNFRRLSISCDGSVFSNMNLQKIGNINTTDIYSIVETELNYGSGWRKLRKNVVPCNRCPYNALCPSISNYEFVLKRYNLCQI